MKILIINTDIDEAADSRSLTGVDAAMTWELYVKYRSPMRLTANHMWDKYTFIDEKNEYIGTFDTMDKLYEAQSRRFIHSKPFLGNVLILTHEQWLDKQNKDWRTEHTHW
tara:strand:- start:1526 stop:1855 length:330 start_codon:yes stop_codon:yes gene_type:complete